MNTVTIPFVDYKMDKMKAVALAIVLVIVILLLVDGGAVFASIIKAIGDALSGVAKGVASGIGDTVGPNSGYKENDTYSARIDKYWTGSSWVNWMTPDLYNSDPSQVTIDQQTASNLYRNIRSAEGDKIFGVIVSHGDMSAIQSDFGSVVGNKFDISYVSYIAQQQEGNGLGLICQATENFYNDSVGSSGKSNLQMLAEFLDWANGLPTY